MKYVMYLLQTKRWMNVLQELEKNLKVMMMMISIRTACVVPVEVVTQVEVEAALVVVETPEEERI